MADNQLLNGVAGGDDIFVYTGGEQRVPHGVKRVRIAENIDTIPAGTFARCRELREVEGHNKLKKIEERAFYRCYRLTSVTKMAGLEEVGDFAFCGCHALSELECGKLESIGEGAFIRCKSLESISMPSVRRVGRYAFAHCDALTDVVFGEKLERSEENAFFDCTAMRRIVIPLKDNLIIDNTAFIRCENLSTVDTLDGEIHKIISSLHMESWRGEVQEEISRINQTLPNIRIIEKTQAIQQWIARVLDRMEHYKSEHQTLLKEAMTLLELALWKANLLEDDANDTAASQEGGTRVTRGQRKRKRNDRCITSGASIVIKNVLPFLALE